MDYKRLAELLFPDVTMTPEELEEKYPPRNLPEGAKVTRFAPSPTGFVHIGGVYQTMVGERLAHQSGGVFYLRIEDTDAKREVPGAAEGLINTLARYGIRFDEGAAIGENGEIIDRGDYGPYKQSLRGDIYHVYAKKLVSEGKAYPCFTTEEELRALEAVDKKAEVKSREWTEETEAEQKAAMRRLREFTIEDVERNLAAGNRFVLRILADGDPEKKTPFTDLVKGKLEIPENDEDFVLCFDASNYIQCDVNPKDAFDMLKDLVVYYHIKDCSAYKVEVPVGTGEGHYDYIIGELTKRGYEGFMTLEPHTFKYAVMKPLVYFVPFVKFAMKDYFKAFRLIDKKMGRNYFACASRKTVFLWQYNNLKKLISEAK